MNVLLFSIFAQQAGGTLADLFVASERGLALALFAAAPFMGKF